MKLYDAVTPNSLRVRVFLAEKGLDIPRQHIPVLDGGTRTSEFLAKNSLGELPTLELDDGRILTESVAICRYLEALHPEPALFGKNPYEQALIEMWTRRMEFHIFGPIGDFARHTIPFFADKIEQVPDYAETQRRRFAETWAWLDSELSDGRTYVAGDKFSVADITGMAALFVSDITEQAPPPEFKHAKRWEKAVRARESFVGARQKAA